MAADHSEINQEIIECLQQRRQRLVQQLEAETAALNAASGGEVVRRQEAWNAVARQLQDIDDQLCALRRPVQGMTVAIQNLVALLNDEIVQKESGNSIQLFMPAYHKALLERTIHPDLKDVTSLVQHLVIGRKESSPNRTLYRFVRYLIELSPDLKLSIQVITKLKEWETANVPKLDLAAIKAEVEYEQAEHAKQKNCLLIKVYSSSVDEYHVKAWHIPDRTAYRQNWPEGAKLVQLPPSEIVTTELSLVEGSEADSKQGNLRNLPSYSAAKIKAVIQSIHQQCCQDYAPPDVVEIFLPKQLMNNDIDSWRLQEDKPRPLFGTRYPILLRSSDRLTKRYLCKRGQQQKWEAVERLWEMNALPAFCEGDPADIDGLYCQGEIYSVPDKQETRDVVGLKLTQPASSAEDELEDVFETVLMDSALPIMIWARHLEVGLECPANIDQVLGCALRQLPEDLKVHRLEAFRRQKIGDCHIGNHLSLIWDDPQLVPPDSE